MHSYDWHITICYNVNCNDVDNILHKLNFLEISESLKKEVKDILYSCLPNVGFTYTNFIFRETLIVIGETTSFDEFLNTLTHENMHAALHISEANDLSPYSESPCYLLGSLIQHESDIIKKFICNR